MPNFLMNPFNVFGRWLPVCFADGGGDSGGGSGGGFSSAYVQELRDEAAGWRTKLREAEKERDDLKEQLTAASEKYAGLEGQNKALLESVCSVLGLDASKVKPEDITAKIKEAMSSSNVTVERAQEALKKAAFMASAVKAGVRKEALEDAYKLADFSGIKVDLESMTVFPVDAEGKQLTQDDKPVTGLDSLVESMVKEKNWLLGAGGGSGQVGSGTNPPGAGGGDVNPWKPETFNLTNQAKILQENPSLAARLKQEAGVK